MVVTVRPAFRTVTTAFLPAILPASWLLVLPPAACATEPATTFGGELRLRAEAFENLLDLDDARHDAYEFFRFRTRLWVDARPRDRLQLYFRLGSEHRWGRGENTSGIRDPEGKLSLDNGWAKIDGPAGSNLSVKLGRQDLFIGEGFLIFDGTPADGSGSAWFDAIRVMWQSGGIGLDLLAAKIDEEGFGTEARDEDLYGILGRVREFELYVLHRNKRRATANVAKTIAHPKQRTTAIGARVAHLPETGPHVGAEAACEFGEYHDGDGDDGRWAGGGYFRGGWTAAGRVHPTIELGALGLSGDDPATGEFEGWDGFYSEWPSHSELLVYTMYDNTTRIPNDDAGTWTNLVAAWGEVRVRPSSAVRGALRVSQFLAPRNTGPGTGDVRGSLVAARLELTVMAGVAGELLGEFFDPGDYYAGDADGAWYGRWQLTTRF